MRFIECEDACGENCLIDPLSVQLIVQYKKDNESLTTVYFTNGIHLNLIESYDEVKRKLNDYMNNW